MTWTKLPAEFLNHVQLLELPRGTRLLHVEALVWCNAAGTDGRIPVAMISRFTDEPDPRAAAGQLVEAGLWSMEAVGWRITDFLEMQPSADDVKRRAALNAERSKRWRYHRDGDHHLCSLGRCNAARAASRAATPTGPSVPTDPSGSREVRTDTAARLVEPAASRNPRRELARAIREAPSDPLRERYIATFARTYGHLYARGKATI